MERTPCTNTPPFSACFAPADPQAQPTAGNRGRFALPFPVALAMLYGYDRQTMREVFFTAWRKHLDHQPLEGIEPLIVAVALRHPEYHALLAQPDRYRDSDYHPQFGQSNPFLHMAMHISLEEQLAADRPPGVREYYLALMHRTPNEHDAQHRAMECLGEIMWRAQRDGTTPSEQAYLECLAHLGGKDQSPT
jgi:hypothetical protein